jgi:hypothetical protein
VHAKRIRASNAVDRRCLLINNENSCRLGRMLTPGLDDWAGPYEREARARRVEQIA